MEGYYYHYKHDSLKGVTDYAYKILCVGTHTETEEDMVVYKSLYGEGGIWIRPLSMFTEMVTKEGKTFPRFTKIEDSGILALLGK